MPMDGCFLHQWPWPILINIPSDPWDLTCKLLSAFGPVFAILFSIYSYYRISWKERARDIRRQNSELIRLAMQYPYLESESYLKTWSRASQDEDAIRYGLYCTEIFNMIEDLFRLCRGDKKRMNNILYFQEYINDHKGWWISETPITSGYDEDFSEFIESCIKEEER